MALQLHPIFKDDASGGCNSLLTNPVKRLARFPSTIASSSSKASSFGSQTFKFGLLDLMRVFAKTFDHRAGRAVIQFIQKSLRLLMDDPLGLGPFLLPLVPVPLTGGLEVIDLIEVKVREFIQRRVEVARDGEIQNPRGPGPVAGDEFRRRTDPA